MGWDKDNEDRDRNRKLIRYAIIKNAGDKGKNPNFMGYPRGKYDKK